MIALGTGRCNLSGSLALHATTAQESAKILWSCTSPTPENRCPTSPPTFLHSLGWTRMSAVVMAHLGQRGVGGTERRSVPERG